MPKATVDGVEVEFDNGMSVLQVAELAGAEVPRFCYHDRLSVAGNCRMCLVEIENERGFAPKPVASCAMPASPDLKIHTKTEKAIAARKGVMEFLLINHPLDCPICDQGGECDLQDQAVAFGRDATRYEENKRAVKDKYMGPLIKTIMTRCIQCTRCVRFATEIAGTEELGLLNRGEHAAISSVEKAISSEMSGNLVDICPVGALTSKPYAFNARPWELRKTPSVDVMDAVGSNIRVDVKGREVLRVLPRLNEDINEEWIADKTRHAIDGLRRQRLDRPYVRENGKLQAASWDEAFAKIAGAMKGKSGDKIAAIAGDQCDAEAMFALKQLMASLGNTKNLDCRQNGSSEGTTVGRSGYLFNTGIAGIEDADAILLVGTNPRWEAPLVNARIRKTFLTGGLKVFGIGEQVDLTYDVDWVGQSAKDLEAVLNGGAVADALAAASKPMIVVGSGACDPVTLNLAGKVAEKFGMITDGWNGFNVLHAAASRVAGLDMGFLPGDDGKGTADILAGCADGSVEVLYNFAADELDFSQTEKTFVIYQGHHGDAGARAADVILPGAAYTEKSGTYVNMEGRAQSGRLASFAPGDAREDWTILRALSGVLGQTLPFENIGELRQAMVAAVPTMGALGVVEAASDWSVPGVEGEASDAPYVLPVQNYYMTCPTSRNSEVMAECTDVYLNGTDVKLAAQ